MGKQSSEFKELQLLTFEAWIVVEEAQDDARSWEAEKTAVEVAESPLKMEELIFEFP